MEGGWRVYSSGAGISVRLIMQCFLGLRQEKPALVVDPVIPPALDGLKARMATRRTHVEVTYRINSKGCGPVSVTLNGVDLDFTPGEQSVSPRRRPHLDGRHRQEAHWRR